jgi:ribonuclease P protein component
VENGRTSSGSPAVTGLGHLRDEANFSTQYAPQEAQARLPRPDEDPRRPSDLEESPDQGSRPDLCLTVSPPSSMDPKRTIATGTEFRRLYAQGTKATSDGLTVHVVTRPDPSSPSRLGLAVPSSTGGAVVRNRIKRRLREAFRARGPASGIDVAIRARAEVAVMPFQNLEVHLDRALRRAGVGS